MTAPPGVLSCANDRCCSWSCTGCDGARPDHHNAGQKRHLLRDHRGPIDVKIMILVPPSLPGKQSKHAYSALTAPEASAKSP